MRLILQTISGYATSCGELKQANRAAAAQCAKRLRTWMEEPVTEKQPLRCLADSSQKRCRPLAAGQAHIGA